LPHHVVMRGNDRRDVFHDVHDREYFLAILGEVKNEFGVRLYHYVLMTNHVHLILEPVTDLDLSNMMHRVNLRYALHHKRKYGGVGHLWQDRYWSSVISNDAYLLTCGIYVELNPVRAGLVVRPAEFVWSSHRVYANDEFDPLVDDNPLMPRTSERSGIYRCLTEEWMRLNLSP
jgi:putative transposase